MPRSKYKITSDDVIHAIEYVRSRLQLFALDLGDASSKTATKEFGDAVEVRSKEERAIRLNAWCEKYLSTKDWTKLKTSIRKRRERKSRKGEIESVTISTKAYTILRKLSMRDNVTYSEILERYLGKAWRA